MAMGDCLIASLKFFIGLSSANLNFGLFISSCDYVSGKKWPDLVRMRTPLVLSLPWNHNRKNLHLILMLLHDAVMLPIVSHFSQTPDLWLIN